MTKKYILKPGRHQFAPGAPASHDNDSLSDEAAEWYLEKYPHIKNLFTSIPDSPIIKITKRQRIKSGRIKQPLKHPEKNENIPATN